MLVKTFVEWSGLPDGGLALEDWGFVGYEMRGELAAIAAVKGTEIHFATAPAWRLRLMTRKRVREFLAPLFERFGFLTTRVSVETARLETYDFLARLGFKPTWHDESTMYLMLTALPFGRGEH